MKPSSAGLVAFDLRPAKQAARRILLDFLKCANEAGLNISECRYVGMGGNRFYDFHLMHRFMGVKQMVSLERDPEFYPRAKFNCPFEFIAVDQRTTAEFLASDSDENRTIYWFDYDDGLSAGMTADIAALGTQAKVGSFAFVTVKVEYPKAYQNNSGKQRLALFKREMLEFALDFTEEDVEASKYPSTVCRVLVKAFKHAFAARKDGDFMPLFQVKYKDEKPMLIVGGAFCAPGKNATIHARIEKELPFLLRHPPYLIRNLSLTERERALFDLAVTTQNLNSDQAIALRSLGFDSEHFEAYKDLLRFLPRYHESLI